MEKTKAMEENRSYEVSCYEEVDCVRTITNLDFRCCLDAVCFAFCLALGKVMH